MNYRRFYEKCTGSKIPEGYEVHHLDGNRLNNKIVNLVSIPLKLHRDFHIYNIKAIKIIDGLNDARWFPTDVNLKCLNKWAHLRTRIGSYEMNRDEQCYKNGFIVEYSGDGVQNFFKSKV